MQPLGLGSKATSSKQRTEILKKSRLFWCIISKKKWTIPAQAHEFNEAKRHHCLAGFTPENFGEIIFQCSLSIHCFCYDDPMRICTNFERKKSNDKSDNFFVQVIFFQKRWKSNIFSLQTCLTTNPRPFLSRFWKYQQELCFQQHLPKKATQSKSVTKIFSYK